MSNIISILLLDLLISLPQYSQKLACEFISLPHEGQFILDIRHPLKKNN